MVTVGVWVISAVVGPAALLIIQLTIPLQPEAVRLRLPPRHKLRSDGMIVGETGSWFTVVVKATEAPVHPFISHAT